MQLLMLKKLPIAFFLTNLLICYVFFKGFFLCVKLTLPTGILYCRNLGSSPQLLSLLVAQLGGRQ